MWSKNRRLFVLIGLLVAAVCAYLALHGLPWSSSDEEVDQSGPGDAGNVVAASTDDPPDARRPSVRGDGPTHGVGKRDGPDGGVPAGGPKAAAVRRKVARLAERPKPEYLPELREAAASPDEDTREAALVGIGRLGKDADTELLIRTLQTDKAPAARIAAATALGQLKCWEAGPALIDALEDPDARVRSRAGTAIDRIIGLRLGFRASDPGRAKVIEKIRMMWPGFYENHLRDSPGRG